MKKRNYFIMLSVLVVAVIGVCVIAGGFKNETPTVCIDAGHGGDDVGAVLGERYEKDDNLRLAEAVKTELENKGVKVIMTRDSDEFISLEDRCRVANRKKADLFVALHRNSAESGNGVEIWVNSTPSETENELAGNILTELEKVGISSNRGVKSGYVGNSDGNYYVNKHTDMPSCLVEIGFITSVKDNTLFDDNLSEYASAVAEGIYSTLSGESETK